VSAATASAVAVYTLSTGGVLARAGAVVAALGLVTLAAGIALRLPATIPWAVLLVGAGYLTARERHASADGWSALVGAALLLSAELASWSIDHDRRIREERSLVVHQALVLGGLVCAAALVGFVFVGAAAIPSSAGLLLTAVGIAAAVASIGVVLRLLR
jgi:hypothetical protein